MCFPSITILGFNLAEMKWSNFSWRALMQSGWKWRRERVVIYQLAILLSITAEAIATYALTRYATHQTNIQRAFPGTYYGQNDLINAGVSAIVPSIAVAFCFGTAFFFLAQYQRKIFPRWYHAMMLVWGSAISLALVAADIACTVIVFHAQAFLIPPPGASFTPEEINARFPHPPIRYRDYGPNIAFIVLLWCALPWVLLSTLLLYLSSRSDLIHGPRPIAEWMPSPSHYDLSPSPSASNAIRRQPSARRPAGVFYWTHEPGPDGNGDVDGVEELGESRSSDETAVEDGVGGSEGSASVRGKREKAKLAGMAMMPGLERE